MRDGVGHDRTAADGALSEDHPAQDAGHGRRAARPVGEQPPTGDAPDRTPGAAENGDHHAGPDHRAGAPAGTGAVAGAGGAAGPDHADARRGGDGEPTGRVDGSPEQQTPPADQQFGRPAVQDGRQTPPADQQFGQAEGRDPQSDEGNRVDEQDPFFQQQQQLREDNGELPPKAPEFRDPQDGSHRG